MKDAVDSLPAERPSEAEGFANRKLIRPALNRTEHTPTESFSAKCRGTPGASGT